ncbi:S66 peptidase family protein [Kitasatospora aureofaciens]|uniref:S66 family peptidase n=1 Tax=Kitasatospora aureofaciens TaxID=1894 RepID=UPI0033DDE9E9
MTDRTMPRLVPPALHEGDIIGVLSPSSDEAGNFPYRRDRAVRALEKLGLRVVFAPGALRTGAYTAGDARQRADDLHTLWAAAEVKAVIAAVGGNNSNQLLDLVNYELLRSTPKLLVGYSDTTALLTAVWVRTGLTTVMGPQLMPQFGEAGGCFDYTLKTFRSLINGFKPMSDIAPSTWWTDERGDWSAQDEQPRRLIASAGPRTLRAGTAAGPVYGANLDTLLRLAGTPYWPDLTGHVVLLEASSPSLSLLDAQLTQLRQTGALDGIVALGFGRFPGTSHARHPGTPDGIEQMVGDVFQGTTWPIVLGLDFGHTDPMFPVPYGVTALLEADEHRVRFGFSEIAVRAPEKQGGDRHD